MPRQRSDYETRLAEIRANKRGLSDSERLHATFEAVWNREMELNPENATYYGVPGLNDRWTDWSAEGVETQKRERSLPLEVIEDIKRDALSESDQLSYELFVRRIQDEIELDAYPREFLRINQIEGVQQDAATVIGMMPHGSEKQLKDMVGRLERLPELIEQNVSLLTDGAERGITPPRITMRNVAEQVTNQIAENPGDAPLLAPFKDIPSAVGGEGVQRITKEAARVYLLKIVPSLKKLLTFLREKYIPLCREGVSWSDLPNGADWYRQVVRSFTTTPLSPEEIHKIGLGEVERIRAEMEKIIRAVEFKGKFKAFTGFLKSDARFFFETREDLVREYRNIAKRADPELAHLFGRLPMTPYGVIPIPAYSEKSQTTAFYMPGSLKAGRPGYYYVNTYDLRSRPKWEMEALSLHEAVPGHHLQIAIAQESEGLPEFRKHTWYTAYGEGWALYAERLGEDMGFYSDPYAKFGQLTYEMWRAIRLVVDTGIHSMGWSRQQAIDYFLENSSKTEHDIVVEVDRYIVWPGQALAYKIGELKIRQLRSMAEEKLGKQFDIRAFHDKLLGDGGMPLDTLEERMSAWVAARSERKA